MDLTSQLHPTSPGGCIGLISTFRFHNWRNSTHANPQGEAEVGRLLPVAALSAGQVPCKRVVRRSAITQPSKRRVDPREAMENCVR